MPAIALIFAAAVPVAWLVPNHYYPWPSAWSDGLAFGLLGLSALICRGPAPLPGRWLWPSALALASIAVQAGNGTIVFAGDALMAAMYVAGFMLAVVVGASLAATPSAVRRWDLIDLLSLATLVSAVASTAIALMQWSGVGSLGIWGVEVAPGERPQANVAQPNHFCTLAFLGLAASGALHARQRLGAWGFRASAGLLMLGMAMSLSRTAWLQIAVMSLGLAWMGPRVGLKRAGRSALQLIVAFALLAVAWPALNGLLELQPGRDVAGQLNPGTRLAHWGAFVDALRLEPWAGYGWQQVVHAQQAVVLSRPPVQEHVEHSHNLVLDLMLWAGIPVGAAIASLIALGLVRSWRRVRDPGMAWWLIGNTGMLVHGLLEYPHTYAYFLVPVGLTLGAAVVLEPGVQVTRFPGVRVAGGGFLALLALVAVDYLEAEDNHRMLRLESARIGTAHIETPAPQLRLLDQLQAFLEFTRTEAQPGMPAERLAWMQRVSQRFAYPPAMFRYATAAALNGDTASAQQTLARLCAMHPPKRCDEAREAWGPLQQRYPALQAVQVPETPAQR